MTAEPSPPPSTDDPGPSAGSDTAQRRRPRTARLAVAAVLGVVVLAAAVGLGWYALGRGPTASAGPDRPEPELEPSDTQPTGLPGVVIPDVEFALIDLRYHCDRVAGQTGTSGAAHQVLCLLIGTEFNPTAVVLEYDHETQVRLVRAQCTVAAAGPLAEIGNRCPDALSHVVDAILGDQPEELRTEATHWVTSNTGEDASTPLADFTLTLTAGTGQAGSRFELVVAPSP